MNFQSKQCSFEYLRMCYFNSQWSNNSLLVFVYITLELFKTDVDDYSY